MPLNPVPVDAAAVGNYPASVAQSVGSFSQTAPGFLYGGNTYEVLFTFNDLGDGNNHCRVFQNNVELDSLNAPIVDSLASVFDGNQTIVVAFVAAGVLALQNFDLLSGTWGVVYAPGAPANIQYVTEVFLNGLDVIALTELNTGTILAANVFSGGSWTVQTTLSIDFGGRSISCLTSSGILSFFARNSDNFNVFTLLAFDYVTVTTTAYDLSQWTGGSIGLMLWLPTYGFALLPASIAANGMMASFVTVDPSTFAVNVFLGAPCGPGAGGYSGIDPYWGTDDGVTLGPLDTPPQFSFDGTYLVGTYWCIDFLSSALVLRVCYTAGNPLTVGGWTSIGGPLGDGSNGSYLSTDYLNWSNFGATAEFALPSGTVGTFIFSVYSEDNSFNNMQYAMGPLVVVPTLIDVQIIFRGVKRYQSGTQCPELTEVPGLPHVKKAV